MFSRGSMPEHCSPPGPTAQDESRRPARPVVLAYRAQASSRTQKCSSVMLVFTASLVSEGRHRLREEGPLLAQCIQTHDWSLDPLQQAAYPRPSRDPQLGKINARQRVRQSTVGIAAPTRNFAPPVSSLPRHHPAPLSTNDPDNPHHGQGSARENRSDRWSEPRPRTCHLPSHLVEDLSAPLNLTPREVGEPPAVDDGR